VDITFPISSPAELINPFRAAIEANPGIKLAVFSHVVSVPAVIEPIPELITLCRQHGILVLVDGAHVVGHIDLNIDQLQPDFYLSNGHKWLYSPTGSAFLYVQPNLHSSIFPTVTSRTYMTEYVSQFEYTGTRDYTAMMSMSSALDFRAKYGDREIKDYLHDLATEAGPLLAQMWSTVLAVPPTMYGAMFDLRLNITDRSVADTLTDRLYEKYGYYMTLYEQPQNVWWTRLSAQIYLSLDDFVNLGHAVLDILSNNNSIDQQ